MIENISINNYALIDHTHIELEKGFSVITGETGAGKSILLGPFGPRYGVVLRRERPRLFRTGYGQEGVDCRRKITLFYQRYPGK